MAKPSLENLTPEEINSLALTMQALMTHPETREITLRAPSLAAMTKEETVKLMSHEIAHDIFDRVPLGVRNLEIHAPAHERELAKEDGVTDYSRSYWERSGAGVNAIGSGYNKRATNETFAEIHAMKSVERDAAKKEGRAEKPLSELGVKPVWVQTYNKIISSATPRGVR